MIAIRFDGPPGHKSGRFIETERDGAGIRFGEWKQDGEYWLLELPEVDKLEQAVRELGETWSAAEEWHTATQGDDFIELLGISDSISKVSDETKQILKGLK